MYLLKFLFYYYLRLTRYRGLQKNWTVLIFIATNEVFCLPFFYFVYGCQHNSWIYLILPSLLIPKDPLNGGFYAWQWDAHMIWKQNFLHCSPEGWVTWGDSPPAPAASPPASPASPPIHRTPAQRHSQEQKHLFKHCYVLNNVCVACTWIWGTPPMWF